MGTLLNTQPVFTGTINKSFVKISNTVATPNHGSAQLKTLFEAGELGSLLESIQVHYTNWGASEPANNLLLYSLQANLGVEDAIFIGQTTLALNAATDNVGSPVDVVLPPNLYGTNKKSLKMAPGEILLGALSTASTAGFNIVCIGGDY